MPPPPEWATDTSGIYLYSEVDDDDWDQDSGEQGGAVADDNERRDDIKHSVQPVVEFVWNNSVNCVHICEEIQGWASQLYHR